MKKLILGGIVIFLVLAISLVGCGTPRLHSIYDSKAEIIVNSAVSIQAESVLYTKYSSDILTTWYIYFEDSSTRMRILEVDGKVGDVVVKDKEIDVIIHAIHASTLKVATMTFVFSLYDIPRGIGEAIDFQEAIMNQNIKYATAGDISYGDGYASVKEENSPTERYYKKTIQLSPEIADFLLWQAKYIISQLQPLGEDKAGD